MARRSCIGSPQRRVASRVAEPRALSDARARGDIDVNTVPNLDKATALVPGITNRYCIPSFETATEPVIGRAFARSRRVGKAKRAHHSRSRSHQWWARRKGRLCPPYNSLTRSQDEVQLVETQQPHARVTASPLSLEERATRASRSMGSKRLTNLT